jgi:hypothetical protein
MSEQPQQQHDDDHDDEDDQHRFEHQLASWAAMRAMSSSGKFQSQLPM